MHRLLRRLGLSGPTATGEPEYILSQDGDKEYRFTDKRFAQEFIEPVVRRGQKERAAIAHIKQGEGMQTLWLDAERIDERSASGCQRLLRLVYMERVLPVDLFEQHEHLTRSGEYRTRMYVPGIEEFFCDVLYEKVAGRQAQTSGHGPRVTCRASRETDCEAGGHAIRIDVELDVDLEQSRADLRVKESCRSTR